MRGLWNEKNWRLDGPDLVMPSGEHVPLRHVLQWQDDRLTGRLDLTGKWSGWRIRQQWLIAPGETIRRGRIAERAVRHAIQKAA